MTLYELISFQVDAYRRLLYEERKTNSMREYITDLVIEKAVNKRQSRIIERQLEKSE